MSVINPDQINAERLAGLRRGAVRSPADPTLGDGSLVDDPAQTAPLVLNNRSFHDITEIVAGYSEKAPGFWWFHALGFAATVASIAQIMILYLIITGVGVWGLNNQVDWAWDITNFVFWIGIGHAGTLISAILCLLKQQWRTAVNRAAEAMTIFAVICAGIFPGIHVGRVWFAWMLFPIPNSNAIWPNFRSPLLWDVFAVSTYATVSLLFWYMGMIPDFATFRDRAHLRLRQNKSRFVELRFPVPLPLPTIKLPWRGDLVRAFIFGFLSLGWRMSGRHWYRYEKAYLILAGISTPLVLSVHSIVSFDFATSVLPGWHTTIFPPYFVAGAIFSGFAMVVTLAVPAREVFGLKNLITLRHLDNMNKIVLVTGSMVGYAYSMEFFIAWYSGAIYEKFAFINRAFGQYWWAYAIMVSCNVITPQLYWFKAIRTSIPLMFFLSLVVNIGMWFERFVIIVTSLHRDFLPSSWAHYAPTSIEIATLAGSFGLFFTCFLLFCRIAPAIAIAEVKGAAHLKKRAAPVSVAEQPIAQTESVSREEILTKVT